MHTKTTFSLKDPSVISVNYWHKLADGRIQCDLCPRFCKLQEGQRGLCFVRGCIDQQMVLTTYGRSSGFAIDPIEKKPLYHFFPNTSILSFGTAGCNLACKFCQNWDISKSREMDTLMDLASPQAIANTALQWQCQSIAYTYNDPVIFHEYAIDIAKACQQHHIYSVAVTAGYICAEPRTEFFQYMDAVNVDLKAFNEDFYWKITGGHLQPVLETLEYLYHNTNTWLEITTLLIPDLNDSPAEVTALSEWILNHLGNTVPLHFTAFHPDFKMKDRPITPANTLKKAREIALQTGLQHVYTGNVYDDIGQSTYCSYCKTKLIGRSGYQLTSWNLDDKGYCKQCGTPCAGVFAHQPGNWGAKRIPVRIANQ